jgi:hypothetical protein
MAAEVISLEHARSRSAARARAERRELMRAEHDELARKRWLADLATWPARFRRVVEPELFDPKCDFAMIATARGGEVLRSCWFAETPADEIRRRLENYRGHIWSVRNAGSKGWRTQRRRLLRHQADRLVEALWLYGIRKVDASMRGERVHRAPEASA